MAFSGIVPLGKFLRTLLLAATVAWLAACARDRGPIVIGAAGPLSQPLGESLRRGMRLAVEQINARGGVAGGRRLELRFVDDSGSPDVAVRVAQSLRDDRRVVAVVGHVTSGPTIAAARVYGAGADPVPVISPTASSPELSGINPWFFRVCPTDVSHGPALALFARQGLGARRAAIVYVNDDYGRGVRQLFAAEFRRLGGEIVEEDPYLPVTPSLEPYLSRLRRTGGVDVLVLAGEPAGAELALREMQRLGLRWPVIGGDGLTGIEATGALAEGLRISIAYLPDRTSDPNTAFVRAYARAHDGQRPDDTGAGAYDALNLLARVLDEGAVDRHAVREHLSRVGRGGTPFEGVTGSIAFDAAGDVPAKSVVIGVVRGGMLRLEASP